MKKHRWIKVVFILLVIPGFYIVGPKPEHATLGGALPQVPEKPDALAAHINHKEQQHLVKPDNEARIIWHDSSRTRTEYVVVYLHGFSASHKEGDPVHRRFAQKFGCNLFLSRLSDHGIDTTDALMLFTPQRIWNSAREALAIGSRIGQKVILMSTSTGGTLALKLAAQYPGQVHALINLSPNIAINDPAAFLLNDPWGLQIARMVMGGKYRHTTATDAESRYWNRKYRLEAVVQLEELIEATMRPETFRLVHQPSLTLYYYKNEDEQDPQVKVTAMLQMHELLATPDSLKRAVAMPDAGAHVMGSHMTSHDVEGVSAEIERFAITMLGMEPVLDVTATR